MKIIIGYHTWLVKSFAGALTGVMIVAIEYFEIHWVSPIYPRPNMGIAIFPEFRFNLLRRCLHPT